MAGLHQEASGLALRRECGVEIFRQRAFSGLKETVRENQHEFFCPGKENLVPKGIVSRQQGFEEMHMGVLPARHCGRNALLITTGRMGKILADIFDQCDRLGAQAFGPDHGCRRGEGEQHEGMIVEIAGPIDRPVVEIEAPGEAAFRKPRRPSKKVETETDGVAGSRHAMARGL
jgi:hypothetical protein